MSYDIWVGPKGQEEDLSCAPRDHKAVAAACGWHPKNTMFTIDLAATPHVGDFEELGDLLRMYLDAHKSGRIRLPDERLSINIQGPPGVGKSAMAREVAASLEMGTWPISGGDQRDAAFAWPNPLSSAIDTFHKLTLLNLLRESGGSEAGEFGAELVRQLRSGTMTRMDFSIAHTLPPEQGKDNVIIVEDWHLFDPAEQGKFRELLLTGAINCANYRTEAAVIGTANRAEDLVHYQTLDSAVANRWTWLEMVPNLQLWIQWAEKQGYDQRHLGFIKWSSGYGERQRTGGRAAMKGVANCSPLYEFDYSDTSKAYATPRSHHHTSIWLKIDPSMTTCERAIAGTIGPGITAKLKDYLEFWSQLPDVAKELAKASKADVDLDKLYLPPEKKLGLIHAFVEQLTTNLSEKTAKGWWVYIDLIHKKLQRPDFLVGMIYGGIDKLNSVAVSKEFMEHMPLFEELRLDNIGKLS